MAKDNRAPHNFEEQTAGWEEGIRSQRIFSEPTTATPLHRPTLAHPLPPGHYSHLLPGPLLLSALQSAPHTQPEVAWEPLGQVRAFLGQLSPLCLIPGKKAKVLTTPPKSPPAGCLSPPWPRLLSLSLSLTCSLSTSHTALSATPPTPQLPSSPQNRSCPSSRDFLFPQMYPRPISSPFFRVLLKHHFPHEAFLGHSI